MWSSIKTKRQIIRRFFLFSTNFSLIWGLIMFESLLPVRKAFWKLFGYLEFINQTFKIVKMFSFLFKFDEQLFMALAKLECSGKTFKLSPIDFFKFHLKNVFRRKNYRIGLCFLELVNPLSLRFESAYYFHDTILLRTIFSISGYYRQLSFFETGSTFFHRLHDFDGISGFSIKVRFYSPNNNFI